jgi:histidinol-phosphate aminotransferase
VTSKQQWPPWLPLNSQLRDLSPYGAPQIRDVIALNTNENPYGLSGNVISAMMEKITEILPDLNRYPDRDALILRNGLARYINALSGTEFRGENIWVANGSNEILQSLFLAFGGRGAIGFTPSYSVHPLIARGTSVSWISGEREGDFTLDPRRAIDQISQIPEMPSLIFLTTPNNPTGNALSHSVLEEIAQACPTSLVVVDEAYAEFSRQKSAVTLLGKYKNIVVVRTMSKAFALAGARVGYLVADPIIISSLALVRLPYHMNSLTQAVAVAALEFSEELQAEVKLLISERERVFKGLEELGLHVYPSDANFLLFTGFRLSHQDLWERILAKGVLIRDVGLPGALRVTIGTPAENDRFLSAMKEALNESA